MAICDPDRFRALLKRALESGLRASGLPALARLRLRGRGVVLAYHNIVPAGQPPGGDQGLHLPQSAFAAQLELLRESCEVVPLADILQPGPGTMPRVAITFDDAYAGAVGAGVDELRIRGMPATVFVCPGRLDGWAFWWDRLAVARDGELNEELRRTALERLAGDDGAIMAALGAEAPRAEALPPYARSARREDLIRAAGVPGITLASHTWSHPSLPALDSLTLERELTQPLGWLRSLGTTVLPAIAYPYGLSSPSVAAAARAAGYEMGLLVRGGWIRGSEDRLAIPRLNVPAGVSTSGFALRMSNLFVP